MEGTQAVLAEKFAVLLPHLASVGGDWSWARTLVLWPGWFAVLWVVVAGQAGGRGIRSDLGVCDGSASQGPQTD